MIFTDLGYFVFLLLSVLAFRFAPGKWRPWVIVVSGLLFYAYYALDFVWLFVIEALLVYVFTHKLGKPGITLALGLPLLILGYYKYSGFLYTALFGNTANPFLYLVFPLAISFFTFEFLHYTLDFQRGKIPSASLPNYLAFIFFYPSMAAGPIKRFQEFNAQLEAQAKAHWPDVYAGSLRILGGLFKKLVVADSLSYFSSVLSSHFYVAHASPYQLWFALLAFTFKVYFDFSGYSDLAIGSARLFGLRIPENFDYPFLARNLAQFWRKWHMSLYSWLNDYLFNPLAVRLRHWKTKGMLLSILAVFSISGLWHGADWNFVAWGSFHGLGVALYFLYQRYLKPGLAINAWYASPAFNALAILFNFFIVTVSFSLFAAPLETSLLILQKLFFLA